MSVAAANLQRPSGLLARCWQFVVTGLLGALACSQALTSVIALGWLQGMMRAHGLRVAGQTDPGPRWLFGPRGRGWIVRLFGGLAQCIRRGAIALTSLLLMTLPFTMLWLVSWAAGWENSFNKGYEQAFVGPIVGLTGVALSMLVMLYLPLALAHQAVEDRAFSMFELRRIRSALAHTGWGYALFAAMAVVMSLPVFAGRGLMVFGEGIWPGLADYSMDEVAELVTQIALVKGAYVFVTLVMLRRWLAGIYARAVMRAGAGPDYHLWAGSAVLGSVPAPASPEPLRSVGVVRWVRGAVILAIWFGLVAQIFVGQFLNHDWLIWLTHPQFLLPWAG